MLYNWWFIFSFSYASWKIVILLFLKCLNDKPLCLFNNESIMVGVNSTIQILLLAIDKKNRQARPRW